MNGILTDMKKVLFLIAKKATDNSDEVIIEGRVTGTGSVGSFNKHQTIMIRQELQQY